MGIKRIESKNCETCYFFCNGACRNKQSGYPSTGPLACVDKVGPLKFKYYIWVKDE